MMKIFPIDITQKHLLQQNISTSHPQEYRSHLSIDKKLMSDLSFKVKWVNESGMDQEVYFLNCLLQFCLQEG